MINTIIEIPTYNKNGKENENSYCRFYVKKKKVQGSYVETTKHFVEIRYNGQYIIIELDDLKNTIRKLQILAKDE